VLRIALRARSQNGVSPCAGTHAVWSQVGVRFKWVQHEPERIEASTGHHPTLTGLSQRGEEIAPSVPSGEGWLDGSTAIWKDDVVTSDPKPHVDESHGLDLS